MKKIPKEIKKLFKESAMDVLPICFKILLLMSLVDLLINAWYDRNNLFLLDQDCSVISFMLVVLLNRFIYKFKGKRND